MLSDVGKVDDAGDRLITYRGGSLFTYVYSLDANKAFQRANQAALTECEATQTSMLLCVLARTRSVVTVTR